MKWVNEQGVGITVVDSDMMDMIHMADLYTNKCTRQQEKFEYYQRNGITWRWEDCQAAFELLREHYGDYWLWQLMQDWRRGKVQTCPS